GPRRATVGRDLRSEVTRSARRERDEGGLTVQRPGEHVELRSHLGEPSRQTLPVCTQRPRELRDLLQHAPLAVRVLPVVHDLARQKEGCRRGDASWRGRWAYRATWDGGLVEKGSRRRVHRDG